MKIIKTILCAVLLTLCFSCVSFDKDFNSGAGQHNKITKCAKIARSLLLNKKQYVQFFVPGYEIFENDNQIKQAYKKLTGKDYKKQYLFIEIGFYSTETNKIYITKSTSKELIIHEILHAYLHKLFPLMSSEMHHLIINALIN